MKLEERLKASDYLLLLLIVLAFGAISWIYQINQFFSYDQTQMLLKGYYAAFTGTYLPFGNEASTMGNLPGMLSSWVIGFPLQLYMHPYAPAVFQTVLRMIGILIFANAISQLFSRRIVLLGTMLFALSPWTLYQTMLYNPAYLTFCAPLVLNCLIRLRNERHEYRMRESGAGRFFASAILVIALGMVVQLHFSWPVLVAGAGILWLRRDIKVSYTGVLAGAALVGLSLWPYVQEVMNNPNLMNNPEAYAQDRYIGYGLVHVYPVFKGLLYWLRFASFSVTQKAIIPEIEDEYSLLIVIVCWVWIILSQFAGVITVIIAAYSNMFALSGVKAGANPDKVRFVRGLTISFIIAVLIASAASPVTLNFWQIAVVMPFSLIPLLAWISVRHNYIRTYCIAALVFFTLGNAIGAIRSDKFDISYSFDKGLYLNCLYGFPAAQCDVMGKYLNAQQKAEVQATTHFSQGIYDRVIKGLIPSHDGSLKPLQNFTLPLLGGSSSDEAKDAEPVDGLSTAVEDSAASNSQDAAADTTDASVSQLEPMSSDADASAQASSPVAATEAAATAAKQDNKAAKANAQSAKADAKGDAQTAKADAKAAKTASSDAKVDAKATKAEGKVDVQTATADNKATSKNAKADSKGLDKDAKGDAKAVKADNKVADQGAKDEAKDTAKSHGEAVAKVDESKDDTSKDAQAVSSAPVLSEAEKREAHNKLFEQAFPDLAAQIKSNEQTAAAVKQSGSDTTKGTANEAQDATAASALVKASQGASSTSSKNESKASNKGQGTEGKIGTGGIVKASEPIIINTVAPAKKEATGVIVDAGSGDSGELIIN